MRVLVVSDIHGNIDALTAVDEWCGARPPFDATWVIGDLVDYGAAPGPVIDWARRHATLIVGGNHDHAMATGEPCGSSASFLGLSIATREHFRPRLSDADLQYLAGLPLNATAELHDGGRIAIAHASPRDPLYDYVATHAPDAVWTRAIAPARHPRFLFVGHTHDQFVRPVGPTTVVNPGSVGLPTDGDPRAAFAVFESGVIQLHRVPYDVERAVSRTMDVPLAPDLRQRLERLIREGRLSDTPG
jgi:predicted phosphodiesterase